MNEKFHISIIPKEIGTLNKLYNLNLNNKIIEIPIELCNMKRLSYLNLGKNQISVIPKEIGNLSKLIKLIFTNNTIYQVPKEKGLKKFLKNYSHIHF